MKIDPIASVQRGLRPGLHDGQGYAAEVNRDVSRLSGHLALCVEDGAGVVPPLFDVGAVSCPA